MGALDTALDTLFASELAIDGTYTAPGGSPVAVRLMLQSPDVNTDLLGHGGKIQQQTVIFELRASQVAAPLSRAVITIGTVTYRVTSVMAKDPRRAVFQLEASPA